MLNVCSLTIICNSAIVQPIKYSKDGTFVSTNTVVLKEFDMSHSRQYMRLKQIVDKGLMNSAKLAEKLGVTDDEEISGQ